MTIGKLGASIKASIVGNDSSAETPAPQKPALSKLGLGGVKDGFENASAATGLLQGQLAKVDVAIKELMNEIQAVKTKEDETQDSVKSGQEQNNNLTSAAEKQHEMLDNIDKLFGN